jgi:hypothetical protein
MSEMHFDIGEVTEATVTVDEQGFMVIEASGPERYTRALATKVWIEGGQVRWLLDRTPWPDTVSP